MHDFRLPALVTLGVVVLMFMLAANVGRARGKYGIAAPATTGNPDFERVYRVQMNTVENAMMFLPSFWIFAAFVSEIWATAIGVVWLASRVWYSIAYAQAATRRGGPFGLSAAAIAILTLGGAWGAIKSFL